MEFFIREEKDFSDIQPYLNKFLNYPEKFLKESRELFERTKHSNLMIPEIHKLDKEILISKLAEFFKLQEGIEFACLFGSMAR